MLNIIKKQITLNRAKHEHAERVTNPMWNLNFNHTVETIKTINKQILLNNLIEASGVNPNDSIAIMNIDRAIEDGKALGMITEFYTTPEEYKQC